MFPHRVVGKHNFRAYGTFTLMCLMLLMFGWEVIFAVQQGRPMEAYFLHYAFVPSQAVAQPLGETLIDGTRTLFMHASFTQLLTNLLFIWVFAPAVEAWMGHRRFIVFFLVVGFGGLIMSALFNRYNSDPIVGPAGALTGTMAAFLLLHPARRIETFIPAITRKFDLPAFFFVVVYFALSIFILDKGPLSGEIRPFWDEFGGFMTGLVFMFVATMFKPAPRVDPLEHLDA